MARSAWVTCASSSRRGLQRASEATRFGLRPKQRSRGHSTLRASSIEINPGDGAFYGPKIDFHIRDVLKRSWQCGTIQLDFSMPARFGLEYVGADGARHTPVMLHRACYGSIERFFGIITENYAGAFPLWLSPVQVAVIPVSDKFNEYAHTVTQWLLDQGLRVEMDQRPDRVGYKIRDASLQKTPYIFVVGEKEQAAGTVNVRTRSGAELGAMPFEAFLTAIAEERKPGGAAADFSRIAAELRAS